MAKSKTSKNISKKQQQTRQSEADRRAAAQAKKAQTAPTPDKPTPVKTFTQPGRIDVKDTKTGKIKHVTQQMIDRSGGQYVPISGVSSGTSANQWITVKDTQTGKITRRKQSDVDASGGRYVATTTPTTATTTGTTSTTATRDTNQDGVIDSADETGTPTEEVTPETGIDTGTQSALDFLQQAYANGEISAEELAFYSGIAREYNPELEVNADSVLKAVEDYQSATLDPYFQKLAEQYKTDIKTVKEQYQASRERELEIEQTNAANALKSAQSNLEASGLTFSGQGVEQLGGTSAYAQNANDTNAIPTQELFGGAFAEGTVNQANRLIASGSESAYTSNLQKLGRSAEDFLGSTTAQTLGIGFAPVGGVTGSLEESRQQALKDFFKNTYSGYANQASYGLDINPIS